MIFSVSGSIISVRLVPVNACEPISTTLSGMYMDAIGRYSNALNAITVTPSGMRSVGAAAYKT